MKEGNVVGMLKLLWKPMVLIAIIYTGLFLLPNKNVYSIISLILSVVLLYKLFSSPPEMSEWLKTIVRVIVFTTIIYYSIMWLGAYGIIGFILIIVLLSAYKIAMGWKLYKYVTSWGADMLRGNNRRFDINEFRNDKEKQEERGSVKANKKRKA